MASRALKFQRSKYVLEQGRPGIIFSVWVECLGPGATSPEQGDFPARLLTSWSPGKSRQGDDQPMVSWVGLLFFFF